MSEKIIKKILVGLCFVVLLIPFIVFPNNYFLYIVGKAFIFRTIVLISLILWALLLYKGGKVLPSKNGILYSFIALLVFYFVSALLGPDFRESIFRNYERMGGWVTQLFLFIYFVIFSTVIKKRKTWNMFFFVQIGTSAVLFVWGIIELFKFGLNHRIDASLGNPIYLAVVLMCSFFFALYLLFEDYSKKVKIALIATMVLNSVGIFFTGTRGVMVGMIMAGIFLAIAFIFLNRRSKKVLVGASVFIAIVVLIPILLLSLKNSEFVQNSKTLTRITQTNISEGSGHSRFINWGIAWEGIKEKPLLGWGQGNYSYVFERHYNPEIYRYEVFFDSPHNTVLETWINGGIFSLIAYLLIFFFAFWQTFKSDRLKREQKFIISGLLIAYFIQNIFVFDNVTSSILLVSILAFIVSYKRNSTYENLPKTTTVSLIIIFSFVSIFFTVLIPWSANANLLRGLQLFSVNQNKETVFIYQKDPWQIQRLFEKALDNNFTGTYQIKHETIRALGTWSWMQEMDLRTEKAMQDFIEFSEKELLKELEEGSKNPRTYFSLGSLFLKVNDFEKAEYYFSKAVEIAPKRQFYMNLLASSKKSLGKYEESLDIKKEIYELDKTNIEPWVDYIIALRVSDLERLNEEYLRAKEEGIIKNAINFLDKSIEKDVKKHQPYIAKVIFLIENSQS